MSLLKKSKHVYAAIIVVFFLACAIFGDVGICPDTETYLKLSPSRDPLYGIFVHLFAFLGETMQLRIVSLCQNLLCAFSSIYLLFFLVKRFKTNAFIEFLITMCLLIPHIMTPMATVSGMILCNTILSEGITLSLYLLFFTILLQIIYAEDNKKTIRYTIIALLLCVLLVSARGQLLSVLVVFVMVSGYKFLSMKKAKMLIFVAILVIAGYAAKIVINNTYNLVANGVFTGNTSQSATVMANALFTADFNKKVDFDDAGLNKVYENTYKLMQEEGMHYQYAPKDLCTFVSYYENAHDVIKFELAAQNIHDYVLSEGYEDPMDIEMESDRVANKLYQKVFLNNPAAAVDTFIKLASSGFIRTVAVLHPILNWYALLAYVVAIGMTVYLFISGRREGRVSPSALVMTLVLIMIAGLVVSTALVTMCLSRYVIYNMSIFYIVALLELCEIVSVNWRKKNEKLNEISEK